MNRIKNKFLRIFATVFATVLAACGITTTFTACYGMPPRDYTGTVIGDLNGDGIAEKTEIIPGIRVTADYESVLYHNSSAYTDKSGQFTLESNDPCPLLSFFDEDGEENGSWENQIDVEYQGPDAYYELKKVTK